VLVGKTEENDLEKKEIEAMREVEVRLEEGRKKTSSGALNVASVCLDVCQVTGCWGSILEWNRLGKSMNGNSRYQTGCGTIKCLI